MVPKPSFTVERRAQVEAQVFPDYINLSMAQLQTEMSRRDLEVASNDKARLVKALRGTDKRDTGIYMKWKTQEEARLARARQLHQQAKAMLASEYKAEPGRKRFLDLPLELRLIIYDLAIFGTSGTGSAELQLFFDTKYDVEYEAETDSLRVKSHEKKSMHDILLTLKIFYAMSKCVREEALGVFWAEFPCRLRTSAAMSSFELAKRFLLMAGAIGSASIRRLPLTLSDRNLGYEGYESFMELPAMLRPLIKLKELNLELGLSAIFCNERDMLVDHFLYGKPFHSPSLDAFANIFESLPYLRTLNIKLIPSSSKSYKLLRDEPDCKLQFIFSGIRELALNLAIFERLSANHRDSYQGKPRNLNDMVVWLDFEPYEEEDEGFEIQTLAEWLKWRDGKLEGF